MDLYKEFLEPRKHRKLNLSLFPNEGHFKKTDQDHNFYRFSIFSRFSSARREVSYTAHLRSVICRNNFNIDFQVAHFEGCLKTSNHSTRPFIYVSFNVIKNSVRNFVFNLNNFFTTKQLFWVVFC